MSLYDIDLPISIKTVSEFRRGRTTAQHNPVEDSLPAIAIDESADAMARAVAVAMDAYSSNTEEAPAVPSYVNTASIQSALHYFDNECSVNAATPTVFENQTTSETKEITQSALAEFMSKALDIESAFEYAGNIQTDTSSNEGMFQHEPLKSHLLVELKEDDGNGLLVPINASDANIYQDMILPDEPSLSSCKIMEDQASVLKDPQEASGTTLTAEKDQYGRVVKALYYGAELVTFQYNDSGELIAFKYAGIDWNKDEAGWSAHDRQTEYFVEARITVNENGSMRIERDDVIRTLKLSGTRIDEHKSGSRTESRKLKNKPSPYDLLAKAKAVNSIWLSNTNNKLSKNSGEHSAPKLPCQLNLVNEAAFGFPDSSEFSGTMIPSIAKAPTFNPGVVNPANLSCVPSAPIELRSLERSDRLRSLEDELLDSHRDELTRINFKLRVQEFGLKSSLWWTDRFYGQSSAQHLEKLDQLAQLYFEQQKNDLAELTHLRALHIREQFFGKGQPELAQSIRGLAAIYEVRGNYQRAEQMYKEAIDLQESGMRKVLFLFSERVTDDNKLRKQMDMLFGCIYSLSNLYVLLGKQNLCAVVYEKALTIWQAISEREPAAIEVLQSTADKYLTLMEKESSPSA